MARNSTEKMMWIVNTIYEAGYISLKQIKKKWIDEQVADGNPLPRRSFTNYLVKAGEEGFWIENENNGEYRYFLRNPQALERGGMPRWYLNILSVKQTLSTSFQIYDRIQVEDVPSGQEHLEDVIKAMKEFHAIKFDHTHYGREEVKEHTLHPYMLKFWGQRWYVVGLDLGYNKMRTYSLDRITYLHETDEVFTIPETFCAATYFNNEFGVFHDLSHPVEKIQIWATPVQACYIRGLPLHWTQEETKRTNEYSIFELRLRVEIDFIQKILSYGKDVQVLEPQSLRDELKEHAKAMLEFYDPESLAK